MNSELFSFLENGGTVVTGNNRLARHLILQFGREQQRRDLPAWLEPDILPWSLWLNHLWNQARLSGRIADKTRLQLLSAAQEKLVWEQVIADCSPRHPTDNPATMARLASRSWGLMQSWLLDVATVTASAYSPDQRAFAAWAAEFSAVCSRSGWLTRAELPAQLTGLLAESGLPLAGELRVLGMDDLNPSQLAVLQASKNAGANITWEHPEPVVTEVRSAVFADADQELVSAARWARDLLQADPDSSIAVLIPDLQERAADVRRVFLDVLVPDWRETTGAFLPPINLSYGQPLVEQGMISMALRLLGLPTRSFAFAEISLLLRSRYLKGYADEQLDRAAAELYLRGQPIVELPAGAIAHAVREHAPGFAELLTDLPRWSDRALPSVWAERFSGLLKQLGWPGEQKPQTAEQLAFNKWQQLIDELAGFDAVSGPVKASRAVSLLRNLCASELFQPAGNPDAVQIMGLLEASGHTFDHLWVCGLTTDIWPQSSQPDPLLSYPLQRDRGMPNSLPATTHSFAATLMRATLASAPSPVVSWPRFRDEQELQAAPLPVESVIHWQPEPDNTASYEQLILDAAAIDRVAGDDDIPPPVPANIEVGGGASLLGRQAVCPARAFMEYRIGARELREAVAGLDAMARGEMMHEVLERWYRAHPDSLTWSTLEQNLRDRKLADIVQAVIEPRLRSVKGPLAIVIAQEAKRLQKMAAEFLELDSERVPFTVEATEAPRDIEIEGLQLQLRLDRLDRLSSGESLVIDYKSGALSAKRWLPPRPAEPQLPLYAVTNGADGIAVAEVSAKNVKLTGWSDTEIGHAGIKSVETLKLQSETWAELVDDWRDAFSILAQEFLAGDFRFNTADLALAKGEFGLVLRTAELDGIAASDDDIEEGAFDE